MVGTLFVLLACAAVQLPWFTCHSDCRDACLPVWDLGAHHCHDEDAADHGTHHCLAHCAGNTAVDAAEVDAAEDDHGPGDHELQTQISRRPVPPATVSQNTVLLAVALPALALWIFSKYTITRSVHEQNLQELGYSSGG